MSFTKEDPLLLHEVAENVSFDELQIIIADRKDGIYVDKGADSYVLKYDDFAYKFYLTSPYYLESAYRKRLFEYEELTNTHSELYTENDHRIILPGSGNQVSLRINPIEAMIWSDMTSCWVGISCYIKGPSLAKVMKTADVLSRHFGNGSTEFRQEIIERMDVEIAAQRLLGLNYFKEYDTAITRQLEKISEQFYHDYSVSWNSLHPYNIKVADTAGRLELVVTDLSTNLDRGLLKL